MFTSVPEKRYVKRCVPEEWMVELWLLAQCCADPLWGELL